MSDFSWFFQESFHDSPGSPEVDIWEFTGLKIAMPTEVMPGTDTIPVCGTWAMSLLERGRWQHISECFVYLVRNVESHESKCGTFRRHVDYSDDPLPPNKQAKLSAAETEEDRRRRVKGYFNFNLARVWKVPEVPGKHRLTIVLDEHQSNDVVFEIKEPQEVPKE